MPVNSDHGPRAGLPVVHRGSAGPGPAASESKYTSFEISEMKSVITEAAGMAGRCTQVCDGAPADLPARHCAAAGLGWGAAGGVVPDVEVRREASSQM